MIIEHFCYLHVFMELILYTPATGVIEFKLVTQLKDEQAHI